VISRPAITKTHDRAGSPAVKRSCSAAAAPMTGCPANGNSSSAVKILADTRPTSGWKSATISSNCRISAVSEISARAPTSAVLPKSTINPLPVNGTSVNTST